MAYIPQHGNEATAVSWLYVLTMWMNQHQNLQNNVSFLCFWHFLDFSHGKGVVHMTELPWKRGWDVTLFLLLLRD